MTTPMPGPVVAVNVAVGDRIEAGQTVLTVEAMKMENPVHAPESGTVKAVYVQESDTVNPDECLIEVE